MNRASLLYTCARMVQSVDEGRRSFTDALLTSQFVPLTKPSTSFIYLLLVCLIGSTSCVVNPITGRKDLMLLSEDQEIAMGQNSDPQITAFYGMYDDQQLQDFIDEKGTRMAALSHRPGLAYDFKILDSPVVNAFAVPGGYVYFTRGIMAHFNNEAEFAGVLGHEIGHIAARHSARQYSSQMLAQLGMAVGMAVSEDFREYSDIALQGLSLLFLKFSRDHESESDILGVEYSSKLGYDAQQMAGFFQTLHRKSAGSVAANLPDFLSTHPHPLDRQGHVQQLARQWREQLQLEDPMIHRDRYLALVEGLVYGEDPRQGYVEDQVFYHPVLHFQYPIPPQWDYSNTTTQVQMAPKGGKALLILTLVSQSDLRSAAQHFIEQHKLRLIDAYEATVSGLPAVELYADQVGDNQGQPVRLVSYFIRHDNRTYQFIGLTALRDFNDYLPTFHKSIINFQELKDPEKIHVKPNRIRIRTLAERTTLEKALRSMGVPHAQLEELAILNGMELQDVLPPGTMLKTIGK